MKKEEIGKKMHREECDKCGSHKHSTKEHKRGNAQSGGDKGDTIEGDYGQHYGPQDKFTKKDVKKEKATRVAKNGPEPKSNWET
jgi:hypothetical protein